jgi:hypothetical protein
MPRLAFADIIPAQREANLLGASRRNTREWPSKNRPTLQSLPVWANNRPRSIQPSWTLARLPLSLLMLLLLLLAKLSLMRLRSAAWLAESYGEPVLLRPPKRL